MRPDCLGNYQRIRTLPDFWQRNFSVQYVHFLPYWSNVTFISVCLSSLPNRNSKRLFLPRNPYSTCSYIYNLWKSYVVIVVIEFCLEIIASIKEEKKIGAKDKCLKLFAFSKERSYLVQKLLNIRYVTDCVQTGILSIVYTKFTFPIWF